MCVCVCKNECCVFRFGDDERRKESIETNLLNPPPSFPHPSPTPSQVNKSARVASVAKGGQIVVSKEFLEVADVDKTQFTLKDLGKFELKVPYMTTRWVVLADR